MSMRRWRAVPFALPAALVTLPGVAFLILVGLSQSAEASVGVGVQNAPVRLTAVARPGQSYTLPPVGVINTGTQAETIIVRVQRLSRGPGQVVPPSWVHVSGPTLQLLPQRTARIALGLVVPGNARPGAYLSDIVVTSSTTVSAGQANFGAAAATKLEFRVGAGPAPGPGAPTWIWVIAAVGIITTAAFGIRRSGLRIRIERANASNHAADRRGGYRA